MSDVSLGYSRMTLTTVPLSLSRDMCDHNNSPENILGRSELSLNKDGCDNDKCFCIKVYYRPLFPTGHVTCRKICEFPLSLEVVIGNINFS